MLCRVQLAAIAELARAQMVTAAIALQIQPTRTTVLAIRIASINVPV